MRDESFAASRDNVCAKWTLLTEPLWTEMMNYTKMMDPLVALSEADAIVCAVIIVARVRLKI